MTDSDFGKPIVAIANSYTQFVPGHVHLKDVGDIVAEAVREAGGVLASSTPSPSTTASPWATAACSIRCPAARSSPTPSSTWSTRTPPTRSSASPTATRSRPACSTPRMRLEHPDRVRVRRSDGGRQGGRRRRRRPGPDRPDHRDLGVGQRRTSTTKGWPRSSARLPDVRLVLGHVHRELDELPHRGARPGVAGQRLDAGHPRRPSRAVPRAGHDRRSELASAGTATTTTPRCRARSRPARRSRTRWRSTWPWAARPTPCCTSSPPRRRARSTSPRRHRRRSAAGCRACRRSRRTPTTTWRTCTEPAESPRILGELCRAGLLNTDVTRCTPPTLDEWLDTWDIRAESPSDGGARAVPRGAGRRAHHRRRSRRRTAGRRWTPTRPAAASATSSTRTPSRAAWPCCAATSPRTAP